MGSILSGAVYSQGGIFYKGGNNLAGNLIYLAGTFWREYNGGNISTVCFPGGKFARRYIFFGGEVEPTHMSSWEMFQLCRLHFFFSSSARLSDATTVILRVKCAVCSVH